MARAAPRFAVVLLAQPGPAAAGNLSLVMFERDGRIYCQRWNEEIGPAYPRTAQGQAAPLRRQDIKAPLPDGMTLTGAPPMLTPTFVLTDDGTAFDRIEGYAGDEFFWVMLAQMLEAAGWEPATAARPAPDPSPPTTQPKGGTP